MGNNISYIDDEPMLQLMTRKIEKDINTFGAIPLLHLTIATNQMFIENIDIDERKTFHLTENDYEKIYDKVVVNYSYGEIQDIIKIEFTKYSPTFTELDILIQSWDFNKTDNVYSRLLNAHFFNGSSVIADFKEYLDRLYEIGYRLTINPKPENNMKVFTVYKENVSITFIIDYDVLTEYVELMLMLEIPY